MRDAYFTPDQSEHTMYVFLEFCGKFHHQTPYLYTFTGEHFIVFTKQYNCEDNNQIGNYPIEKQDINSKNINNKQH